MRVVNIVILLLLLNSSSCRKIITRDVTIEVPQNFNQVFDRFWQGIKDNYLFWDVDTTNWDNIYSKYKPLFERLNLKDSSDVLKSVSLLKEIVSGMIDGHFQLQFQNRLSSNIIFYPAFVRKQADVDFHYPYDYIGIDTNYFDQGYQICNSVVPNSNIDYISIAFATINDSIIYFRSNKFALFNSYHAANASDVRVVLDSFFNAINDENKRGLIIDVRNNDGGNVNDLNFLFGNLIDSPLHFGYTQYKNGVGRFDFTPMINAYITPTRNAKIFNHPIVVLADKFTVSLGETVTMIAKALPKGIVIGERTWGATGSLAPAELYNAGQFVIPDFLTVYMSSAKFKDINEVSYEGIGVPPDIFIPFDYVALNSGRDLALEKAISLIK